STSVARSSAGAQTARPAPRRVDTSEGHHVEWLQSAPELSFKRARRGPQGEKMSSPAPRPREKAQVLDETALDRALTRIAHEILEKNGGAKDPALATLGLPTGARLPGLTARGHRELPIRPDYVGKNLPTSRRESVAVRLREHDGEDRVVIEEPEEA